MLVSLKSGKCLKFTSGSSVRTLYYVGCDFSTEGPGIKNVKYLQVLQILKCLFKEQNNVKNVKHFKSDFKHC